MDEARIRETVLGIIGEIAPEADLAHLDPAIMFREQFEFSSIDFLTFATRLQQDLKIEIPETECPELASLNGCLAYLKPR
ncbi:acyl carrier protein [Desulfonema ishimotonii]|uniref:Acyl carrier protein n=1 Tax=Desulfonema ishimotonii TaxID=45657 RepID=A0A401FV65_9BACT|nr:phosphopantetheine-binding protein [Desulfonema ishimotonii]GBC60845.1 acyl carrier protein [Desulfonema ishimotonii]